MAIAEKNDMMRKWIVNNKEGLDCVVLTEGGPREQRSGG